MHKRKGWGGIADPGIKKSRTILKLDKHGQKKSQERDDGYVNEKKRTPR